MNDGGVGDGGVDAGTPRIVLGTGGVGGAPFVPLEDGAILHLHHGVQGGVHVTFSVRGFGIDPDDPDFDGRLYTPESSLVTTAGRPDCRILRSDVIERQGDHWTYEVTQLRLNGASGEPYADKDFRLVVRVKAFGVPDTVPDGGTPKPFECWAYHAKDLAAAVNVHILDDLNEMP